MSRFPASFAIGPRAVGAGAPCLLIAEAGVNHNGDLDRARALVRAAAAAGADAVKFQTWRTEKVLLPDAPKAEYQRARGGSESQFEMLKALELPRGAFALLRDCAAQAGILFLSTPDEEESLTELLALGVEAVKVGSGELDNLPFLARIGAAGRPVILSTGMGTLEEVGRAVEILEAAGAPALALLHCVTQYPAPPASSNLRALETLARSFDCPVGFSDHTLGIEVALAAVARGACIIEKHFTLDRSLPGPDHAASLEPDELARLAAGIRTVESALGDGIKRPVPAEEANIPAVRKVLVAAHNLAAGGALVPADLSALRGASGIPVGAWDRVVGRRLRRAVAKGTALRHEDLDPEGAPAD